MEARAAMGGPGAWSRVYLKTMCSKSTEGLTPVDTNETVLKYWTTSNKCTVILKYMNEY